MIKKTISFVMVLSMFNLSIFAGVPLDRGTSFAVRVISSISSKGANDSPSAMVENNVKDSNGNILIKRGTPVQLQLEKKKAKGCGKAGYVLVKCVSTTAIDGQHISLEGSIDSEGDDKKGLAIGLGVGLGVTFLPFVGFAFLAIKGEEAKIESNTLIPTVFVMNDYNISQ